jgi:phage baseplate assembly protein W
VRDLAIVGGDLLVSGGDLATVTGTDYLRQRVATALSEPYGSDPFHPQWGSALTGMLGSPQLAGTGAMVTAEASRVLAQLMAAQQQVITATAMAGTRSQLAADDVIASVDSVTAAPGSRPDAIAVAVSLTTQGGQRLSAVRTVSP